MQDTTAFIDIIDIIRQEFTLKKPLSATAEALKQKIISAENSVALHFRHGDYAYNPALKNMPHKKYCITPLEFYRTCVDILKHRYSNLTAFVFSDNLPWVKDNLRLDVPTEFVEDCATDLEEFVLMSLCKHDIIPTSTFSQGAAALNANPDKKILWARAVPTEEYKKFIGSLTPARKDSILNSNFLIRVPFDENDQPDIIQRPIFSLLLVVNEDAATIAYTLNSLLGQDYKFYEVIILDNASTDGSSQICQQAVADRANVTFKRLDAKIKNAEAWNLAFSMAQGQYVSFLKSGDRFLSNTLTEIFLVNYARNVDIIHTFSWLEENANGTVTVGDKKYFPQLDAHFKDEKREMIFNTNGQASAKLLASQQLNSFLGTKFYYREFLTEHELKFDEKLADDAAELSFQTEAFVKSKCFMYVSKAVYITPRK